MIDFNPKKLTFENVDRFYIKKSIYQFLMSKIHLLHGELLDIGCGEMPYKDEIETNSSVKNYIGLDIYEAIEYKAGVKPDYFWDGVKMPFENHSFDCGFATEVLEHCPDPMITLQEVYRVLKPNSPVIFTVPFLWPTHESPNDFYRYTPFAIEKLLKAAGFSRIDIECLGGWDASLAQMLGLWIKRRGISKSKQRFLYFFLKFFILALYRIDHKRNAMSDQNMFTGLGIIAWK
jgi:SAM-dependent methyltransferase